MVIQTNYAQYARSLTTSFHSTHQDKNPLHAHSKSNAIIVNATGMNDDTVHLFDNIGATDATAIRNMKNSETHIGDADNANYNIDTQLSAASSYDLPFRVV